MSSDIYVRLIAAAADLLGTLDAEDEHHFWQQVERGGTAIAEHAREQRTGIERLPWYQTGDDGPKSVGWQCQVCSELGDGRPPRSCPTCLASTRQCPECRRWNFHQTDCRLRERD